MRQIVCLINIHLNAIKRQTQEVSWSLGEKRREADRWRLIEGNLGINAIYRLWPSILLLLTNVRAILLSPDPERIKLDQPGDKESKR